MNDTVVTHTQHGSVALLTLSNPPVNALSHAVRTRLWDLVAELDADPSVAAIVLAGAGKIFCGGADVGEFDLPPQAPLLPELLTRIEAAAKPWVAAIQGQALGGGLELALACAARVAEPGASLALPEVNLGLIPGAGGTQRLPRLIGLAAALPVIAERARLEAARAAELGLIDHLAAPPLIEASLGFAASLAVRPVPALDRPLPDPGPAFWQEARARIAATARGQAAPLAALAAVRYGVEQGAAAGLAQERETFLTLRGSDEAAALRHLFFAERAATRPADLRGIAPLPVARVGVVGGGTMGAGIAAALVTAGLTVILSERDDASLARGLTTLRGLLDAAARRGLATPAEVEARMAAVTGIVGLAGLAPCDLVIEAVFEDLATKRAVFAELGQCSRRDAILATNTSYIDPRQIAADLPGPERFVGLHFFSPAQVMKLLEIVPLPQTAPPVLATAFALADRLGKVPVRAGICDGFIGNRILKRTRAEAEALLREGLSPEAIDAALRGFGYAMGPFEMQDMAGLDISFQNREAARARGEAVPVSPGDLLVRAGRKGVKTGGGYYDYAPGSRTPLPSTEAARLIAPMMGTPASLPPEAIVARILAAMQAEGEAILAEGIASRPADIDLVLVHGYGFPRTRGGPMFQASRTAAR